MKTSQHSSRAPRQLVRLIASPMAGIATEAIRQIYAAAGLEGMRHAVGFPDLHAGRRTPVGAAFVTDAVLYPHLIGGDIGCGMALFNTELPRHSASRVDEWARLRFDLEHPWNECVGNFLAGHKLESTTFDAALGTIGGGNHFAELQAVDTVLDAAAFKRLGLSWEQLVVLVHSGSNGLGESALHNPASGIHGRGLPAESAAAAEYLRGHDLAVRWARANRALIAKRFVHMLETEGDCVWDGCHNSITRAPSANGFSYLHRKGAVAADDKLAVIPGSCGTLSYLVKPTGDGQSHAWSLPHGAGRKWSASDTRLRMRARFAPEQLTQTPWGGRVICEQSDLLYEEAPAAYKNIEAVIEDLVDAGLVSVIATFRPLLTYKTRKAKR